jgi:hypothetical protein
MFIMLSVLEGTQRVPPTCTTKTDFTYVREEWGPGGNVAIHNWRQRNCQSIGTRGGNGNVVSGPCRPPVKISHIEKNVSLDPTRLCLPTYNKHLKIYPRINSTFKVIRACICIMFPVLAVTQRVPPTCIIKTSRTVLRQAPRPWHSSTQCNRSQANPTNPSMHAPDKVKY